MAEDGVTELRQQRGHIDPLVVLIPVVADDQSPAAGDGAVLASDEL